MSPARWLWLVLALVGVSILAIAVGTIPVPISAIWDGVRGVGDAQVTYVVRALRLPRVVMASLVGVGLGMSGAALQGTMRNPLAEPYLLGVSGGAAVGAVLAQAAGVGGAFLPLAAFVGAIVAVMAA